MKTLLRALVGVCVLMLGAAQADAAPIPFDFTLLGSPPGTPGPIAPTQTTGGVTVTGWADFGAGYTETNVNLWLRNQSSDHGLGVCSETTPTCTSGAGDVNEISNQARPELIRLEKPSTVTWNDLWVSSLDSGGTNGHERGTLAWGNTTNPASALGSFSFQFGDFGGAVEGNIVGLSQVAASSWATNGRTAQYLFFTPASNNGTNNDYLVWKGTTAPAPVPEPASLLLVGSGLLGAATRQRRKAKR